MTSNTLLNNIKISNKTYSRNWCHVYPVVKNWSV